MTTLAGMLRVSWAARTLLISTGGADDPTALARQDPSGFNPEKGGWDTSHHAVGLLFAETYYTVVAAPASVASVESGNAEILNTSGVARLIQAMASFEASYMASNGSTFNPASAAGAIADSNVLAVENSVWRHQSVQL